jgi:outer membrane protein assembly factor BamC
VGIYKKCANRSLLIVILGLYLGGCGYLKVFRDKGNDYLLAERNPPTEIPDTLDSPPFSDTMIIPEVADPRGISGQQFELPLPDPLSSNYGVDRIVIRKLGDNHWIFLDAPTATIWSKLREYFILNNLDIGVENPGQGIIETEWLVSQNGSADQIYESLTSGQARFDSRSSVEGKLRMKVAPGVRQGSSEVRIQYVQTNLGNEAKAEITWHSNHGADSDEIVAVEDKVLTELAQYLGETINQSSTISLLAGRIANESRAILVPDKVKPILKYTLDFDRAWSTVGSALGAAGIEIEDRDRTSAMYYILYDPLDKEAGFLTRLFTKEEDVPKEEIHRYVIKVDDLVDNVQVTVHKDASMLAEADFAERLLRIIKEYST